METQNLTSPIALIIGQYELQNRLFNNVVNGIKNEDAAQPMNENTNHVAWLIGHIVSTRYMIANLLGLNLKEPYPELFENGKGLQKDAVYPNISDLTEHWTFISSKLIEKLNTLTTSEIKASIPFDVPTGNTMGDYLSFCAHHEAYTIGQLGLYRRYLGYEPMKYS